MEKHLSPEIIITCEHAGNSIPAEYLYLFLKAGDILSSHRGWDPGALQLAEFLSKNLRIPLRSFGITRLLIEVNRSLNHRQLFSEFSKILSAKDKNQLIENYYTPYRGEIEQTIREKIETGRQVIHIGVHTFTPIFRGKERPCDIGLLFDPTLKQEKQLSAQWKNELKTRFPELKICFNKPYKGTDDGLTTYLRSALNSDLYSGIELEVNQKHLNEQENFHMDFSENIAHSIRHLGKLPA